MSDSSNNPSLQSAKRRNALCNCATLDRQLLLEKLEQHLGTNNADIFSSEAWQQFFSETAVFISQADLSKILAVVQAIERVSQIASYQEKVLSWAPAASHFNADSAGVFMGYDFHLGDTGPQLIEINTNAGGAFLNAALAQSHRQCCDDSVNFANQVNFNSAVIEQFQGEWQAQINSEKIQLKNSSGRLKSIAIVDQKPTEQYLYPEFVLAKRLFEAAGIKTLIVSPDDLRYDNGVLYGQNIALDMVYNRLVDFSLSASENNALRQAWLEGSVVISPNPYNHALFADKRNLTILSDVTCLTDFGVTPHDIALLSQHIPRCTLVSEINAESLWQSRQQWFFKPVAGHGSKGVYKGSKLTKKTFTHIMHSQYMAQTLVPPSNRLVSVNGEPQSLKVDVRLYTYKGNVLMSAARLYQGQTTNFRTAGGGFAPLLIIDAFI